jgi:hypothetical protein
MGESIRGVIRAPLDCVYNGRLGDKFLTVELLASLTEAKVLAHQHLIDYNILIRHSALKGRTPRKPSIDESPSVMEGGLINPASVIKTGAAMGVTSPGEKAAAGYTYLPGQPSRVKLIRRGNNEAKPFGSSYSLAKWAASNFKILFPHEFTVLRRQPIGFSAINGGLADLLSQGVARQDKPVDCSTAGHALGWVKLSSLLPLKRRELAPCLAWGGHHWTAWGYGVSPTELATSAGSVHRDAARSAAAWTNSRDHPWSG